MNIKLVSFKLCPFVQRAVIALEEKGVEYALEYIELADPPAWFTECSPFGRVPLMLIDDTVLFESAVILDYLDEVYLPRLHPQDPLRRARHKAWIEYGSELLRQQLALGTAADEEGFVEALTHLNLLLDRLQAPLNEGLFGGDCDYSLVDAAYAPFFMRAEILATVRPQVAAGFSPAVAAWSQALLARPSLKRSVVSDFTPRYLRFLQQKGSWLAARS
ncbi:MAG: glutathione S-transferase family protein [Candidatus Thiodiazotropha sp.]|jgi:glutathione S-transferase